MVSGNELGILSTVHLDHMAKGGWMHMTSEALRAFEVVPALARVEVIKEEDHPGREEKEAKEEEDGGGEFS